MAISFDTNHKRILVTAILSRPDQTSNSNGQTFVVFACLNQHKLLGECVFYGQDNWVKGGGVTVQMKAAHTTHATIIIQQSRPAFPDVLICVCIHNSLPQ